MGGPWDIKHPPLNKDELVSSAYASYKELLQALSDQVRSRAVLLSTGNVAMTSKAHMQVSQDGTLLGHGYVSSGSQSFSVRRFSRRS